MPPMFVNVGAYVGEGTMIDSHALIGSCAQIGRNCHISAGSQIGGVLEPVGALPVIIEDEVLVGGNSGVYEGTVVKRRAVLGTGTILNRSIPVYDLVRDKIYTATETAPLIIPEEAIVVPGSRAVTHPSGANGRFRCKRHHREISRCENGCARAARRPLALALHCVSTFSKNCSARGSFDCPSQNIACLPHRRITIRLRHFNQLRDASSFGSWLSAKTAFFFTSVSGSLSIAPVMVPTALFPAFCASKRAPGRARANSNRRAPCGSFHRAHRLHGSRKVQTPRARARLNSDPSSPCAAGSQSGFASCGSHPEGRLSPQCFALLRRHKRFDAPVGRCVRMQGDRGQCSVANPVSP